MFQSVLKFFYRNVCYYIYEKLSNLFWQPFQIFPCPPYGGGKTGTESQLPDAGPRPLSAGLLVFVVRREYCPAESTPPLVPYLYYMRLRANESAPRVIIYYLIQNERWDAQREFTSRQAPQYDSIVHLVGFSKGERPLRTLIWWNFRHLDESYRYLICRPVFNLAVRQLFLVLAALHAPVYVHFLPHFQRLGIAGIPAPGDDGDVVGLVVRPVHGDQQVGDFAAERRGAVDRRAADIALQQHLVWVVGDVLRRRYVARNTVSIRRLLPSTRRL